MSNRRKNGGFTLAEVMIAVGLLGIVSLGVMHLISNMAKTKDDFQSRFDQMIVKATVERVLASSHLCATALQDENGEPIQLEKIFAEDIPNHDYPEIELERKYIVSSIRPFDEVLMEEGKNFSGITVGKMTLDKILMGSNPSRKRFRLNLNVALFDTKNKNAKKSLNWPIEFKVDTDENNLVVKCQLHFIDSPHYENSGVKCVNLGPDSRGMDTGLCPRGTQGGFSITKISPSGSKEHGNGASWRRQDFAKDYEVNGCALLPLPDPEPDKFLTALCWGDGLWLLKILGPKEEEKEEVLATTHVTHPVKNTYISGCLAIVGLDGDRAQTGLCWGDGLHFIKTEKGKTGIERDWNVATHLPDIMFTSCVAQSILASSSKRRLEANLLCTSEGGVALVKITPIDSIEGDRGIGLEWHAAMHD